MKKIPTLFERDWDGDRSRVLDQVTAGCEWVLHGEGVPTRKYDGTCCLIRDGVLYKRRELKPGDAEPAGIFVGQDETTGKRIMWVPVGASPEDRWHREAFDGLLPTARVDGTYELVGPRINGNPEDYEQHNLIRHDLAMPLPSAPRRFADFPDFFTSRNIEGIVYHHPDGRMAKIKARDFGIRRGR